MPGILRNENRSAFFASVWHIVKCDHAAAFQDVEGFGHVGVSVNRDARTFGQLLRAKREMRRSRYGVCQDEDVATITKVNQMIAFAGTKDECLLHLAAALCAVWHRALRWSGFNEMESHTSRMPVAKNAGDCTPAFRFDRASCRISSSSASGRRSSRAG